MFPNEQREMNEDATHDLIETKKDDNNLGESNLNLGWGV